MKIIDIIIFIVVLIIIIGITLLVLNKFSPSERCEDKPDNYIVSLGGSEISCGELNAINTTTGINYP